MEKSCRADIAFQLMERMKLEEVSPNVHVYNSAISACARCKLWQKGLDLFKEMDAVGVKRDVVTYNAVLGEYFFTKFLRKYAAAISNAFATHRCGMFSG
jgi:pentatricopeptide repeat protein